MKLSETQREFARDLVYLKIHILASGNEFTEGDSYRDPRVHGEYGVKGSYASAMSGHKRRLAGDVNLFIDGEYQTTTEAHRPYGEYWKSLNPLNIWGGDFTYKGRPRPDGNHYERKHK